MRSTCGLQTKSYENANKIRHFIALAYLPPNDIPVAFELLEEKVLLRDNDTKKIVEWYQITYVKGKRTSRKAKNNILSYMYTSPPLLSPGLWSLNLNTTNNMFRRQNSVETLIIGN